jgi:hypothetical protein
MNVDIQLFNFYYHSFYAYYAYYYYLVCHITCWAYALKASSDSPDETQYANELGCIHCGALRLVVDLSVRDPLLVNGPMAMQ